MTTSIEQLTIEAADTDAAERFYTAFELGDVVQVQEPEAGSESTGFRGFTLSLIVSQPATADAFMDAAVDAGGTAVKPTAKSLWGYGGTVQAPDGTICTVASSAKKNTGPATQEIDEIVLQLGLDDVGASKQFYIDQGFEVAKAYGRRYIQWDTSPIKLAFMKRRSLAKNAGVPAEGTGSHRLIISTDTKPFTDPDDFVWQERQRRS